MMYRMKELLAVLLIALAGTQVASANPPASTSESTTPICAKLPPLWQGFLCTVAGRYDRAIAICNEVLRDKPNNLRAYVLRGYAHLFKKNEGNRSLPESRCSVYSLDAETSKNTGFHDVAPILY